MITDLKNELEDAVLPLKQDRDRVDFLSEHMVHMRYLPEGRFLIRCGGLNFVGNSFREATDRALRGMPHMGEVCG